MYVSKTHNSIQKLLDKSGKKKTNNKAEKRRRYKQRRKESQGVNQNHRKGKRGGKGSGQLTRPIRDGIYNPGSGEIRTTTLRDGNYMGFENYSNDDSRSNITPYEMQVKLNIRDRLSKQAIETFSTHLKRHSSEIGINRREGFEDKVTWMDPVVSGGTDHVIIAGSEYVTSIEVNTTTNNPYTLPGDTLYYIPTNPKYFEGTRLALLAVNFTKYKHQHLVFEFIPVVPTTQGGAFIHLCLLDGDENPSTIPDQDVRLRRYMGHKNANFFNIMTNGRAVLGENDDTNKFYYLDNHNNPTDENQGAYMLAAATTFPPSDGSSEVITVGQLVVHYKTMFLDRNDQFDDHISIRSIATINNSVTLSFAYLLTGEQVAFLSTIPNSASPAITFNTSTIYILIVHDLLRVNAVSITCQTSNGNAIPLMSQGSVWFASWITNTSTGVGYFGIFDSLEDAILRLHGKCCLNQTLTGANAVTCTFEVSTYGNTVDTPSPRSEESIDSLWYDMSHNKEEEPQEESIQNGEMVPEQWLEIQRQQNRLEAETFDHFHNQVLDLVYNNRGEFSPLDNDVVAEIETLFLDIPLPLQNLIIKHHMRFYPHIYEGLLEHRQIFEDDT